MNYMVLWTSSAEGLLAQIWMDATDRDAVTAASNSIDAKLREDPVHAGESRRRKARILIVPPLAVYFRVNPGDRQVLVSRVWRWGT